VACLKETIQEIYKSALDIGVKATAEKYEITRETVRRRMREAKAEGREAIAEPIISDSVLYKKLCERFSPAELSAIANGKALNPHGFARPVIDFDGDDVCIGFVTDTHIGGKEFGDSLWMSFLKECEREGVEMILHAGDVHEGMSNRPEQVYNLNDIGVSAQMEHARELFSATKIPIKVIDGNHDRWGIKSNGLFMVRDLCERVPNAEFIGCDIGEVVINGSRWMLWHGEDGSSYATSYRVQKLIESFTGGSKPHVLLCGHTHKQGYFFERNVHAVSGGALSYQSDWMRSTRKACHTGFHIISARIKDGQIVRFSPTFYPFYN
jgi:predicted phosphodiesterase